MEITRRNLVETVAVAGAALAASSLGAREALATKELSSSEAAAGAGAFVEADMSITDEEALAWLREEPECKDIVLEDGTVVPAKYVRLRLRIDRAGGGVGGTPRDGSWKWLLENLTEEDVDNLLLMPVLEWFQAGDLDLDVHTEEEWRQICEELSLQGYLMRVRRAGIPHFHQLAFVHGLFEFSVLKHRDEDDNVQNITDVFALTGSDYSLWTGDTPVYHPLPVSADLVTDAHVLPYDDWKAIIARNTRFAVAPCQCRHAKISLGALSEDCTHPVETCMAFGEIADYYIENGIGREIDAEEADAILQRSVDAGMVIESEFTKASEVICSCHSDCCYLLGTVRAADGNLPAMANISNYVLNLDKEACIQCGACLDRCPMHSITFGEDGYPEMDNACVKCGQCGLVCPANARSLSARPEAERLTLAEDMLGDYVQKSINRMRKGIIVDTVE